MHLDTGRLGGGPLTWTEFYEEEDALVAVATREDPAGGPLNIKLHAKRDGRWFLRVMGARHTLFGPMDQRLLARGQVAPGINPWAGDEGLGVAWFAALDAGIEHFGPEVWHAPDVPLVPHAARERERAEAVTAREAQRVAARAAEAAERKRLQAQEQRARRVRPATYLKAALRTWPVTDYAPLAGFLLPDGQMLDFSGGSGMRAHDHREITSIHDALPGSTTGMEIFMEVTGAIRIGYSAGRTSRDPAFVWLHAEAPPTEAQVSVLSQVLRDFPIDAIEVVSQKRGTISLAGWPTAAQVAQALRKLTSPTR